MSPVVITGKLLSPKILSLYYSFQNVTKGILCIGPTGSGKTYTFAHSILAVTAPKVAQEQTNRVLICTYSNEAADK